MDLDKANLSMLDWLAVRILLCLEFCPRIHFELIGAVRGVVVTCGRARWMTALLMLSNVGLGCMVGMAPMCSLTLSKVKLIVVVCFETRCSNLVWRNRLVACCLLRACCRYGVMLYHSILD